MLDVRDIGTVVFLKAELKIFMAADNAVRVQRRFKELFEKNPNVIIEKVKNNMEIRDYIGFKREAGPWRKARNVRELDNTDLTENQQFQKVLEWVEKKSSKKNN